MTKVKDLIKKLQNFDKNADCIIEIKDIYIPSSYGSFMNSESDGDLNLYERAGDVYISGKEIL